MSEIKTTYVLQWEHDDDSYDIDILGDDPSDELVAAWNNYEVAPHILTLLKIEEKDDGFTRETMVDCLSGILLGLGKDYRSQAKDYEIQMLQENGIKNELVVIQAP